MRPHGGRPIARGNFCPRHRKKRDVKGAAPAKRAHKNCARAHSLAERSTANPEKPPARNSVRIPEGRNSLPVSTRRGLLGFAGLAPHSGRSSVPFRRAMFRDRRYSFQLHRAKISLTNNEV